MVESERGASASGRAGIGGLLLLGLALIGILFVHLSSRGGGAARAPLEEAMGSESAPVEQVSVAQTRPEPTRVGAQRAPLSPAEAEALASADGSLYPLEVIVRSTTGAPLSGVSFHLRGPREPSTVNGEEREPGRYRLLLPAGRHALSASRVEPPAFPGEPREAEITLPYAGPPLVLVLSEAASLLVQVQEEDGGPVPEAHIELRLEDSAEPLGGSTDATGRCRWEGLPPGAATASVSSRTRSGYQATVLQAGQASTLTIVLPAGGWLLAHVSDRAGNSRPEASLNVVRDEETLQARPEERYGPLAPGSYHLLAVLDEGEWPPLVLSANVEIEAGRTTEVELAPSEARIAIEGTVTSADGPCSGLALMVLREGRALVDGLQVVQCDESGHYRLELAEACGVVFAVRSAPPRAVSYLPPRDEPRIEHSFYIERGALSGRVVVSAEPSEAAPPATGWRIHLEPMGRAIEIGRLGGEGALLRDAEEDGSFEFLALEPGPYRLWAVAEGALAGPVKVELRDDEELEDVELVARAATRLEGRVVGIDGAPLEGALVRANAQDGSQIPFYTRTDPAGRFELEHLPPGPCTLWAQGTDAVGRLDLLSEREGASELRIVVSKGARILVGVRDAQGQPAAANVRLFDGEERELSALGGPSAAGDSFSARISASEHGFGPLPPGQYELRATSAEGASRSRTVVLGESDITLSLEL